MGYEPEDLPWEVPLIELGLDSLMAVRIKNRVEYDFDMPPIQLTAVRDANLYNVEKMIAYAVEHRDEVQALHEHQQTQTAEEIAAEQAAMIAAASAERAGAAAPAPAAGRSRPHLPSRRCRRSPKRTAASDIRSRRRRPTRGPVRRRRRSGRPGRGDPGSAAAGGAKVLTRRR